MHRVWSPKSTHALDQMPEPVFQWPCTAFPPELPQKSNNIIVNNYNVYFEYVEYNIIIFGTFRVNHIPFILLLGAKWKRKEKLWFLEEHKDLPIWNNLKRMHLKCQKLFILLYCSFRFDLCSVSSGRSHFWYWNKWQVCQHYIVDCFQAIFINNYTVHLLGDHPHKFNLNQFYFKPLYYLMRIRWHFINTILLDLVVPLLYKQLLFLVPMSWAGVGCKQSWL